MKSANDLQKSLDEKYSVENEVLKLKEDLKKTLEEKDFVKQENLRLKLDIEQMKNREEETKDLKSQNKRLKKKLSSVMKLVKDEDSSSSSEEPTPNREEKFSEEGISFEAGVPSTSSLSISRKNLGTQKKPTKAILASSRDNNFYQFSIENKTWSKLDI